MKIKIEKSVAIGSVTAPPSKSYAHRLLICSALAEGESTVANLYHIDRGYADFEDKLRKLGAKIRRIRV